MTLTPRKPLGLLLALWLLPGCVDPYRANFNPTQDRLPSWTAGRLAPPVPKPRLSRSEDIQKDSWSQFEQGFVMVGFARFDGPKIDPAGAVAQAKRVGASVVLVQDKFTRSLTETVAVTQWPADETTEVRTQGQTSGNRGTRAYDERTEVRTSRGPETVYVPQQTDIFEHSATYWRKLEGTIFGALVTDLSDAQRKALQSNQGLVVRAVMVDSPAFRSDLLKGDIIREVNGAPVPSAQRFYEELANWAGKEIRLTVLRGSDTVQRSVKLNL